MIEVADLYGGKPLALTYGPANFFRPMFFVTAVSCSKPHTHSVPTQFPKSIPFIPTAAESSPYRCDHGTARHSGRQVSSGDIVFASVHGLARFTSSKARKSGFRAGREYAGEVTETAAGDWLVPWRAEAKAPFQLMLWTPGSPDCARYRHTEPDSDHRGQPVVIMEHAAPNRYPSGLHDWPNANLLCLNAYTSKYPFARGSIHSVRLYTRDADGTPKLLGTAPVERDGSFFVQVPTEQPCRSNFWMTPGRV